MVFTHDGNNKVSFIAKLDQPVKKGGDEETMSAMDKFRSLDKRATGTKEAKSSTTHTNTIVYVLFVSCQCVPQSGDFRNFVTLSITMFIY